VYWKVTLLVALFTALILALALKNAS